MTREEALQKGYLEDRKVYLKPNRKKDGKLGLEKNHSGNFLWEGAKVTYIYRNIDRTGKTVNPFKNDEEKKFFEEALGMDLNIYNTDSKWYTQPVRTTKYINVVIVKTADFMANGIAFDLSDPEQNLQHRVLLSNKETNPYGIARSPEEVEHGINYKFVLVEDGFEDTKNYQAMDMMQEIFMYYGGIKENAKKMRDFLGIYLTGKFSDKNIPTDASKDWLASELNKAFKDDYRKIYTLIKDPKIDIRIFVDKAMRVGQITKTSINAFKINEEGGITWSYEQLLDRMAILKESQDNIYMKIDQLIKSAKI